MNNLVAVSLWIALVTVVPGLITIASIYGAIAFVDPEYASALPLNANEWIWSAVAVVVMILTQAVGILVEGVLVNRRWLGDAERSLSPGLLDADEFPSDPLRPYEEYERLYPLLVRLKEGDDTYGHLERAVAQFFLTNNTLVSFGAGIVTSLGILVGSFLTNGLGPDVLFRGALYLGAMIAALVVSYLVAVARFHVLTLSTWSLRTEPARE